MAIVPVKSVVPPNSTVCTFCDQLPYQATLTECNHLFCQKPECLPYALETRPECPNCRKTTSLQDCVTINLYLKRIAYYLSHQPELITSRKANSADDHCSICLQDNDPPVHFISSNLAKEKIGELLCNRCYLATRKIQIPGRVYRSFTPFQVFAIAKELPPIPFLSLSFSGLTTLANATFKNFLISSPEACLICDKVPYEKKALTECGHLFCQTKDCLEKTLNPEGPCPVCRTVTQLQKCATIDVQLKVIIHALSQSAELLNSKMIKLSSGRCTICQDTDDPAVHFITKNTVKEKVGKFLCHNCFDIMGPIPAPGRVYQALTSFQIVALAKELPPLTSTSRYITISAATLILFSFCHRVINENAFENQNPILSITATPADISIKIVNFILMLMKKQPSSV